MRATEQHRSRTGSVAADHRCALRRGAAGRRARTACGWYARYRAAPQPNGIRCRRPPMRPPPRCLPAPGSGSGTAFRGFQRLDRQIHRQRRRRQRDRASCGSCRRQALAPARHSAAFSAWIVRSTDNAAGDSVTVRLGRIGCIGRGRSRPRRGRNCGRPGQRIRDRHVLGGEAALGELGALGAAEAALGEAGIAAGLGSASAIGMFPPRRARTP